MSRDGSARRARPGGGWPSLAWRGFRRLLAAVRADRRLLVFVAVLFAVDLFWIAYFAVGKTLLNLDRNPFLYNHKELLITTDGGIPEWFGYLVTVLIVVLLIRLARSTRQLVYAALTLVFLVVLFDDAMGIHESFGKYLARRFDFDPGFGLRPRDVGEVITWALLGVLVVPPLLVGLRRATPPHRENGLALLLPFGALLVCAILVDQLYGGLSDAFFNAGVLLDVIEDGGELLAITLTCALVLGADRERRAGAAPGGAA